MRSSEYFSSKVCYRYKLSVEAVITSTLALPYVSVQLLDRSPQRGLDVPRGDGSELMDGIVLH